MNTETLTLTDFLLARIAEDEAEIGVPFGRDEKAGPNGIGWAEVGAISEVLMCGHVRAHAECEAKRRIVEEHAMMPVRETNYGGHHEYRDGCCQRCTADGEYGGPYDDGSPDPCDTLKALAAVYADHESFREEWRP